MQFRVIQHHVKLGVKNKNKKQYYKHNHYLVTQWKVLFFIKLKGPNLWKVEITKQKFMCHLIWLAILAYNCSYYIIVYYFLLFKCKVDHPNKPTEFGSKHNYLVLLLIRKAN